MANVSIPIIDDDDISEEPNTSFTVSIIPNGDVMIMSNDPIITIVDDDHSELRDVHVYIRSRLKSSLL